MAQDPPNLQEQDDSISGDGKKETSGIDFNEVARLVQNLQQAGTPSTININFGNAFLGSMSGFQVGNNNQQYGSSAIATPDQNTNFRQNETVFRNATGLDSYDKFADWFFELGERHPLEPEFQMHVLATAIFNNNSWQFIEAVRDALVLVWLEQFPELTDEEKEKLPTLNRSLTRRSTNLYSETLTTLGSLNYEVSSGTTSLQVLRFINPQHQEHALRLLGEAVELAPIRRTIDQHVLQYLSLASDKTLKELNSSLNKLTRTQAAYSIGVLARYDYVFYLQNIIEKWAESPTTHPSQMVTWVLLVLYSDERYRSHVIELLKSWADVKDYVKNYAWEGFVNSLQGFLRIRKGTPYTHRQWTAAYACRFLGWVDLGSILVVLRVTLISVERSVFLSSLETIATLYYTASNTDTILKALAEWSKTTEDNVAHSQLKLRSLIVFQILMQQKIGNNLVAAPVSEASPDPELKDATFSPTQQNEDKLINDPSQGKVNPELPKIEIWELVRSNNPQEVHSVEKSLIILTEQSLMHRDTAIQHQMNEIIQKWLKFGERRPEHAPIIQRVLAGVASNSVTHDALVMLCEFYYDVSNIARALHHQLKQSIIKPKDNWDDWAKSVDKDWDKQNTDEELSLQNWWLKEDEDKE